MDNTKEYEEKNKNTESIKERVIIFYNKNKKELLLLLGLLIVFNFMCPSRKIISGSGSRYVQLGGDVEEMLEGQASGSGKAGMFSSLKSSIGNKGAVLKKTNILSTGLSWMLSLVQSLLTFCGLIIALAILPGLPVFIFMLILFFILRARMAAIKSY